METIAPIIAAVVSLSGAVATIYTATRKAKADSERNAVEGFDALCDALHGEIARMEAKIAANEEKMAAMEQEMAAMRAENAELRAQIRRYEQENADLRRQIDNLRAELGREVRSCM